MKFDKKKLELTHQAYYNFQMIFNGVYKAFAEGKQFIRIRNESSYGGETAEDNKAGLCVPELHGENYTNVKRVMINLMANGLARVLKIKPEKKPGSKDRIYSYLQVYPTDKGREMYEHDGECPIAHWRESCPRSICVGKTFKGFEYLKKTLFEPYKAKYSVAMSRWFDEWSPTFDELYETSMINMTEEEAKVSVEAIIEELLIPNLPIRRTTAAIRKSLETNNKLAQYE